MMDSAGIVGICVIYGSAALLVIQTGGDMYGTTLGKFL